MPDAPPTPAKRRKRLWIAFGAVAGACLVALVYVQEFNRGADLYTPNYLDPDVDVPFVVTPNNVVDRMLELAKVTQDDLVYDLGCGDGRIVVAAAKRYGCRAIGVDIDPMCVGLSLKNVRENAECPAGPECAFFRLTAEGLEQMEALDPELLAKFLWTNVSRFARHIRKDNKRYRQPLWVDDSWNPEDDDSDYDDDDEEY